MVFNLSMTILFLDKIKIPADIPCRLTYISYFDI